MPKSNDDWIPIEILEALKEQNISINELAKKQTLQC